MTEHVAPAPAKRAMELAVQQELLSTGVVLVPATRQTVDELYVPQIGYRDLPSTWLVSHAHRNSRLQTNVAHAAHGPLPHLFDQLRGNEELLLRTPRRVLPHDLIHRETGIHVEVDEIQHFTRYRGQGLLDYRSYSFGDAFEAGFDLDLYLKLVETHQAKAARAFAHKQATAFPGELGRQRQRAFNDAVRDFAIAEATGKPVIRIAVPERDAAVGVQRAMPFIERWLL